MKRKHKRIVWTIEGLEGPNTQDKVERVTAATGHLFEDMTAPIFRLVLLEGGRQVHPTSSGPSDIRSIGSQGLQIETVPFGACGSYVFHATGNLDSPHRVFEFRIPVKVSKDVVVSFSAAADQKQ